MGLKAKHLAVKVELPSQTKMENTMRLIPIQELYSMLYTRLLPILRNDIDSRMTNLILLMVGLYYGRSVHLSRIANEIPHEGRRVSLVERLRRFLSNSAVNIQGWYEVVARQLLEQAARTGRIILIVDSTKVGPSAQLMMVALAYHRRSLPVAWTWVKHKKGHSPTHVQLDLLRYLQTLVPHGAQVVVVGDSEFGRCLALEELDHFGWGYVMRQSGDHLVWPHEQTAWCRLDALPFTPNVPECLPHSLLTEENAYPTTLVLYTEAGHARPWFLATNLRSPSEAVGLYRQRMWIEEMFGDLKSNGFDLEATHLRQPDRLDRLTLAICLLYVWCIALGAHVVQSGLAPIVDRKDRRDLSLFRLGFDFLRRTLLLRHSLDVLFLPPHALFCSVLGG